MHMLFERIPPKHFRRAFDLLNVPADFRSDGFEPVNDNVSPVVACDIMRHVSRFANRIMQFIRL